jgi:predicted alpha/beta hydrolase family esterase
MKFLKHLIIISYLFYFNSTFSMQQPQGLTVYAIPGQNGLGSEPHYIQYVLQPYEANPLEIIEVPTPGLGADLGQNNCIRLLANAIEKQTRQHQNTILYATSQGTATALNYIAHSQDKNPQNKIDGLVLEATLGSGNSAIHHTVSGPLMGLSTLARIPFSYYWMPYVSKLLMPFYWPGGKQPIKSIEKISTDLPIVIIHSEKDPQLSFNDACALYYGLRKNGNDNVYLIPFKGMRHIQILRDSEREAQVVREILAKHVLLQKKQTIDLSAYQPNPQQFKIQYDALVAREKWHNRLKYLLGTSACAVSAITIKALCSKYGLLK